MIKWEEEEKEEGRGPYFDVSLCNGFFPALLESGGKLQGDKRRKKGLKEGRKKRGIGERSREGRYIRHLWKQKRT